MSIKRVSTKNMSREDWLKRRRKSIGGSDAGAILGLSKFSSPYAVWAEKTEQLIPEDISDRESVRLGNDLEQYVADRFSEATGKKLYRPNCFIYNSSYPFAHANIDRAVRGEPDAGFEAKTTSSYNILSQCLEGKYPDIWYCQVTHYMMVTGAKRWYLGVLCLGRGFFHFTIERNQDEIDALAAVEKEFWDKVESKTPPPVDGSDTSMEALRACIGDSEPDTECDLGIVSDNIAEIVAIKAKIKELEDELNLQQAQVMQFMKGNEAGYCSDYSVSFKTQLRRTFDRKHFEADNGQIPDKYFKTSATRPLKIKNLTEKGDN